MKRINMVIGVTGGVGTGKSTILQILQEEYQAAVILTDDIAKEFMEPGQAAYFDVIASFGEGILSHGPGSFIDRRLLSEIVFHDPDKLNRLNAIIHPLVKLAVKDRIRKYQSEGVPCIVIETAILIQAGFLDLVDELWVVVTDYEVRAARLTASRGYSREKIDTIIRNQWSDEQMCAYADLIIDNSGDLKHAREQIRAHFIK